MASLVLSVAGAAAGFAIGGPQGASIGWAVGSALGGALFPPSLPELPPQFGPRLGDLKVQTSAYGVMLPRIYGTARVAGNVMWSRDIVETATTTTTSSGGGGKGGGGGEQTQTQTTYSYSQTLAISLCDAPTAIVGVRKIWANGKLIYNVAEDAGALTVLASSDAFTFYLGGESQEPSALMESFEGAGNVPAYKGTAYVEIVNLQLAPFGNRTPQFEFEVVAGGSDEIKIHDYFWTGDGAGYTGGNIGAGESLHMLRNTGELWLTKQYVPTGAYYISLYDVIGGREIFSKHIQTAPSTATAPFTINTTFAVIGIDLYGNALMTDPVSACKLFRVRRSGDVDYISTVTAIGLGAGALCIAPDADGESFWGLGPLGQLYKIRDVNWTAHTCTVAKITGVTYNGIAIHDGGVGSRLYGMDASGALVYIDTTTHAFTSVSKSHKHNDYVFVDSGGSVYCATTANTIIKMDQDLVTVATSAAITGLTSLELVDGAGYAWGHGTSSWTRLDTATLVTSVDTMQIVSAGNLIVGEYASGAPCVYSSATSSFALADAKTTITPGATTLASIVTAECALVGADTDIDVSALTGLQVDGYVVAQRGPVRGTLEPLMSAYFIDATEVDSTIKFVARGAASAVTIPLADLSARTDAMENTPESFLFTRKEELALPVEVNVAYNSRAMNYQTQQQPAKRIGASGDAVLTVSYAVVMDDDRAAQIANAILFSAWQERNVAKFSTGREYSKYVPTDVVTVTSSGASQDLRITRKDEGVNGVINWEGVITESAPYAQTIAGGASGATPDNTILVLWNTVWAPLDIPVLRAQDDAPGFYFAASGINDNWHGMQLYRSIDSGVSYSAVADAGMLVASTLGRANGALATYAAASMESVDNGNSVSVTLNAGELASVTRLQMLNGANYAMLGSECIQFITATLTGTDTYTLSGLMRGRLGTAWAVATHVAGEAFTLLNGNIATVPQALSDRDRSYLYKPVTAGRTVAQTPAQEFSNGDIRLKPFAVTHLAAGRNADGDWLISFDQCPRYGFAWADDVDALTVEATEAYEIDVMNGSTVLRTISVSSASATYTNAQQSTDSGSPPPSTLTINVYQISASIGRGYVTTGTFS